MIVKVSFERKNLLYILLDIEGTWFKEVLPQWCVTADEDDPSKPGLIAPYGVLSWIEENLGLSLPFALSNSAWESLANGKTTFLEMV